MVRTKKPQQLQPWQQPRKLLSVRADLLLRHNRIGQSRLRQARRTHRLIHRQNLTVNHLQRHNRDIVRSATLKVIAIRVSSNLRQVIGRTYRPASISDRDTHSIQNHPKRAPSARREQRPESSTPAQGTRQHHPRTRIIHVLMRVVLRLLRGNTTPH